MTFKYTHQQLEFLREKYQVMRIAALTLAFNRQYDLSKTPAQIRSTLKNHGIVFGRRGAYDKGTLLKYTSEQLAFIRAHAKTMRIRELVAAFNREFGTDKTASQIMAFKKARKIKSADSGNFQKGHQPWNNGTKGMRLTTANTGSFKKGTRPHNHKPLGSISIHEGYLCVKVTEADHYKPAFYKPMHLIVWEATNGAVPDGMIVSFRDGNRSNYEIENLELITRAENLHRNKYQYAQAPAELKPSIRSLVRLELKRFELMKANS